MEIATSTWILNLLSYATFKDVRLVKRFGLIIESLIQRPNSSIPEANDSWASTKGTYRFFANNRILPNEIKDTFIKYTSEKANNNKMVLIINDTTEISYGGHKKIKVGGYISTPNSNGIFLHSALMLNDKETPEGLVYQKHWKRNLQDLKETKAYNREIEEKETYCWIEVLQAVQKNIPENVPSLIIGDRGSDIFELFIQPRRENSNLLIRAAYNRTIDDLENTHLFNAVNAQPSSGTITIKISTKEGKERNVILEIRFTKAKIKKPHNLSKKYPESISMNIISAKEISASTGEDIIEWKLLTTMQIESFEMAIQCVKWYSKRWIIE